MSSWIGGPAFVLASAAGLVVVVVIIYYVCKPNKGKPRNLTEWK